MHNFYNVTLSNIFIFILEQCGVNEEYVENPVCRPKTCSDMGYPLPCLELNSETTSNQGPGCICKAGYVRDGNGTCISDRECRKYVTETNYIFLFLNVEGRMNLLIIFHRNIF